MNEATPHAPSSTRVESIFTQSTPGVMGLSLPPIGVATKPTSEWLPEKFHRKQAPRLPEVAQLDVVRHFVNLSQLNHAIDKAFYPLGSCTMKYNPKICDVYGNQEGLTQLHPMTPDHLSQGALKVMYTLQQYLSDISGFYATSLQPAAGAQGEWVGMRIIKAYFEHTGQNQRTQVIIPDSAHGTNPASAAMCGFDVVEIKSKDNGLVDVEALKHLLSDKTAALMLTNPSTVGLFERDILEITTLVHDAGGLLYYDGANLNAVLGQAQPAQMGFDVMHINTHKTFATPHGGGGPGSGPVAVTEKLAPFLPKPLAAYDGEHYYLDYDRPLSIGKVKAFWGNFEMMARALIYILAYGADGLKQVSSDAVLNANYLKVLLSEHYQVAFDQVCKHEFILTNEKQRGVDPHLNTMAIVKRLMDFGYHPPTVYFPLIVREAMMIEPTETESKETLDKFAQAMIQIAKECAETPGLILNAPYTTPVQKVDEVLAARKPDLNYFKSA
ncbi:MAG: aminomethyl-transferring glycine dehydrogenase subunit GcvPB [Vampirovibrionales bacterium]|nr:aminomethyl-transferring glycine dehydrogenase subunit GcvPB [Vampirovibrionales bacterium]